MRQGPNGYGYSFSVNTTRAWPGASYLSIGSLTDAEYQASQRLEAVLGICVHMKYIDVVSLLRRLAPEDTALEGDPVGMLIEPGADQLRSAIVCLDATEHVAHTAIEEGAGLIVAHHPLIYNPLKRLERSDPISSIAMTLVQNGIGLYAMHTNWDAADGGINDTLAELVGINRPSRLQGNAETRIVRIGDLDKAMKPLDFLAGLKDRLQCAGTSALRFALPAGADKPVRTICVCGGAGASLTSEAIKAGADAYVTADVRHHEFIDAAARGLLLIDAGHEATEAPGMQKLARTLAAQLPEIYTTFCPNTPANDSGSKI
jgi:dinuclear metal center YbgI/SA1388 family protein